MIIVAIVLTGPFGVYMVADIFALTTEQLSWSPENLDRLSVRDYCYSQDGIKLSVYAPSGVAEVWRGKPGPLWESWQWPWEPHYCRIPFGVVEGDEQGELILLVRYEFRPRAEWLLAIKSHDGYWEHMSPYFGDEPDITDEEWDRLVAASRQVLPHE